ncbi:protein translocase subunit SecF [Sphingosinicella sp. BN140058]|uniref:protein translocase subunit SecF n=1 Tax=Sphingosinicella sp. BN140058 TaxID=1892855 RepID=UPI001012E381|nr:protein translocase subunit SecF [Sphingosinicella sp. BN140058]QAY77633.1 protein translocase subunit SecF [Sphingosinicella sp. BN140058]
MRLLKLVPDNTNFDFMRWRNVALVLSIIVTVASIALVAVRGLNLGVDFVGGQMINVTFSRTAPIEEVRETVEGLNVGDASIQEFGDPKTITIRMGLPDGGDDAAAKVATRVREAIAAKHPDAKFTVDSVSGKVSNELYRSGAISVALAMLGIAIYIWFRFEWQFGVGALVTLFHDVCMTIGFFSLTQLEFNLNVVAAILTIVGYSLNDTVVIYDRIREDLRKYRKMEIVPLLNVSLNETLSRTMVTSLSIMFALLALLLIGPQVIFGLTIAIFLGIFVGTYSSIYISSPILVWLGVSGDSFLPKTSTGSAAKGGERVATPNEGY